MQKGIDIDVQLERLSAYGLRGLVDFDKYTALSIAESLGRVMQSRIVILRPPSSPWLLRRRVAIWIRILNSSERTSSPSLQRESTLGSSIVSPKWISFFVWIVLALSFLQVAFPGTLSDPVLLYAISVVFQATLRLRRG